MLFPKRVLFFLSIKCILVAEALGLGRSQIGGPGFQVTSQPDPGPFGLQKGYTLEAHLRAVHSGAQH